MRAEIDREILDLEKQKAKAEYGLKYTFTLSRDQGASLVISNEPCDIHKRREFDKIWKETALLDHDQETLEGLARRLTTLNVVTNGVHFKRYVESLSSKSRGSAASSSILSKRRYVAGLLRNDRVRAFTTGPSFNYGFFDVVDTGRSKVAQATTGQMYGNPRYALYMDSSGLHGTDLWDPVVETGEFPADFPYFSPTDFSPDQGVDLYGRVYSDVVLRISSVDGERTRAQLKPCSNILMTPDLKLGWFEFPPSSVAATEEKYDRVREAARDLLRNRKAGISDRFARFARAQLEDDMGRFLTALEYVRFTRYEPKNMEWFAKEFPRPLLDKSFETLVDVYAATFGRFDPLTAQETDSLEYLLDTFPKYNSGVRAAHAAEEIALMRTQFTYSQMSPEAVEAAMYLYNSEVTAPWTTMKVASGALEMAARIDKPFDYDQLPVLSERLRDVVRRGLDFIGLRMPATPSRTSRDVLLHRRPDFYEAVQRGGVSAVLTPLKNIMETHNFTDVLKALKRHLVEMGYYDSSSSDESDDDEYSLYNRNIIAPETYAVKQAASRLRDRSRVVASLEDTIMAELRYTLEELTNMVEAGVLPTPSLLLKVNKLKRDLVELASGKRETVTEQMRTLLSKARVSGLKASIDESIRRMEVVMDKLESFDRASASVERARRDLAKRLISARYVPPPTRYPPPGNNPPPPPSKPYIPKDKPRRFTPPPQNRPMVVSDDGVMVEEDEQQPTPSSQPVTPQPSSQPAQRASRTPSVASSSAMGCVDVQKVEYRPPKGAFIPYMPVSEKWRMKILGDFFADYKYKRASHAIRVYDVRAVNPNEVRETTPVAMDGNCLYRAIAHVIFGDEEEYMRIRQSLISYAETNQNLLVKSVLMDKSFSHIAEDRVWGTSDSMAIASVMLNTKIFLYSVLHGGFWAGPGILQYNTFPLNPFTDQPWEEDEAIYIELKSNHFTPAHNGVGTRGEDMVAKNLPMGRFLVPTLTTGKLIKMDCDFIRKVLSNTIMKKKTPLKLVPTDGEAFSERRHADAMENNARRNLMSDGISDDKMKFLKNYVNSYDKHRQPGDFVTFQMVWSTNKVAWNDNTDVLIKKNNVTLVKREDGRIQDPSDREAEGVIRVDFANKKIAGGTIFKRGSAQEEMLFLSAPEAIVSMMFLERPMKEDEAVVIKGVGMFSDYVHHQGRKPEFLGSYPGETFRTIDLVAVDAYDYRYKEKKQFSAVQIDWDLNKIYAAFNHEGYKVVRSGNLGGGVFKGDIRLKFALQVIVCAYVGIHLEYCCYEPRDCGVVKGVLDVCDGKTISQLYNDLITNWDHTIGRVII